VDWFYVTGADIAAGALDQADVLLVPGGGWRHGNGQLQDLDAVGTAAVVRFIEAGGGYLSSCAGSMIAMRHQPEALLAHHPTKAEFTLLPVDNWERLRNSENGHRSPGIGVVKTRLAATRHPVGLGLPDELEMTHYNGPIFLDPGNRADVVLQYAGVTEGFTPSECFHGCGRRPSEADLHGSDMAAAGSLGLPAVVAGTRGRGRVVMAGLHPEFGLSSDLANWGRPVQLIGNALFWLAQSGHGATVSPSDEGTDLAVAEATLTGAIERAREAVRRLQEVDRRTDPAWLDDPEHRAAFGLTPAELWRETIDKLPAMLDEIATAWNEATRIAAGGQRARLADAALQRFEPAGGPDLGAQGAVWLVQEATNLIGDASAALAEGGPARVRAEARVSRSYLSAVGVLTNAKQRLQAEIATYVAEADLSALATALSVEPALAGS
jgi:hypothetical protein